MIVKYHWRSLVARRWRAAATAGGIGLAVFVALAMLALARGITSSFQATGHPLNVLVTSRGAETIEFSALERRVFEALRHRPEVATAADGLALASPEILFAASHERGGRVAQALVRGVLPVAQAVHDQVRLIEGRFPRGPGEIAIGPLVGVKLGLPERERQVGQVIELDGIGWTITGRFEAPGTAFEAEIWGPLDEFMAAYRREELNAVVLRVRDAAALEELLFELETRRDLLVAARTETDYYAAHAGAFRPVSAALGLMTGLLALGGSLIGMNTLFASTASRTRELGVLRALGFRRGQLALGMAFEGLVPALAGSLAAMGAVTLMQGFALRLPMGAFRIEVSPGLLAAGLALGLVVGCLGSIAAVVRTLRLSTIQAIRHL